VTKDAADGPSIRGSLRSGDGGVVHLEGRFNTGIDDLWSVITDPGRLAQWHARVKENLHPGGTFRRYVEAADWEGTGRVEAREAPRHLVVMTRESEESWRKRQGMPPFGETIDATLTVDDNQTFLTCGAGS
jgi:uncharacterized protein YndB with AHSA1/START domain